MAELAGYGFTYEPGGRQEGGRPTELFAWQVALLHTDEGALEDADNYPDYLVNRARITQMLGLGMSQGQNAFTLDGQLFVAAVSVQDENGDIVVIGDGHPCYRDVALVVSEQLLRGEDHGMVTSTPIPEHRSANN